MIFSLVPLWPPGIVLNGLLTLSIPWPLNPLSGIRKKMAFHTGFHMGVKDLKFLCIV
jgi:hypothetical protein